MRLEIPYPPSANRMWRAVRGRTILSKQGREYYDGATALAAQRCGETMLGPLSVTLMVTPPDRRRRDLDNTLKPILDLGTKAGIWGDDSQVVEIHATKAREPVKGGSVIMEVTEVE